MSSLFMLSKRSLLFLATLVVLAFSVSSFAERTQQEQDNIDLVVEFYNVALNDLNAEKALTYLGDTYIQHNPVAQNGPEGLAGFINYLKGQFPQNHNDIKKAYADGDHVFLHVHSKRTPDSRGNAIIDIFRVDDGKIVEHWDVIQEIPAESANDNTMFYGNDG